MSDLSELRESIEQLKAATWAVLEPKLRAVADALIRAHDWLRR